MDPTKTEPGKKASFMVPPKIKEEDATKIAIRLTRTYSIVNTSYGVGRSRGEAMMNAKEAIAITDNGVSTQLSAGTVTLEDMYVGEDVDDIAYEEYVDNVDVVDESD